MRKTQEAALVPQYLYIVLEGHSIANHRLHCIGEQRRNSRYYKMTTVWLVLCLVLATMATRICDARTANFTKKEGTGELNWENDRSYWKEIPGGTGFRMPSKKYFDTLLPLFKKHNDKNINVTTAAAGAGYFRMSNRTFPWHIGPQVHEVRRPQGVWNPPIYATTSSSGLADCWMPSQILKDKTVHCSRYQKDGTLMFNRTVEYPDFMYYLYAEAVPNGIILITRKFDCHEEDCFIVNIDVITQLRESNDPSSTSAQVHSTKLQRRQYKVNCLWDLRQRRWALSLTLITDPNDGSINVNYYCNEIPLYATAHTLRVT